MLGASLRGLADTARAASREGAEVLLFDQEKALNIDDLQGNVTVLPQTWSTDYLQGVDRIVTSPWFAETKPPLADAIAAGVDIITEAGFGLERLTVDYLAVTGTNGKTTVTEAATAMLVASGVDALAGGNVGRPVSQLSDDDADLVVLELSSYQLRFIDRLTPIAAALLNIAPDHLDWHGSFDRYVEAKARIFASMDADAVLAYNADDPVVVDVVGRATCVVVPCSGVRVPDGGNGVDRGDVLIGEHRFITPLSDSSFLFDLVAAATIAMVAGARPEGVAQVLTTFSPGDHRRQIVSVTDGVTWINDSKATNPHATVSAAAAYEDVILLAGGRNKDLDLTPLVDLPTVRTLIVFGEAADEIASVASGDVLMTSTMEDAVAKAREVAVEGDTVLLSPGCASFDEFSSYAERGESFTRLVHSYEGIAG